MERRKLNKYLIIANLSSFIFLMNGRLFTLPDILHGFCSGITVSMFLIGIYAYDHDINKLKEFKRKLAQRLTR